MVNILADPWESAQDGDEDENTSDDTRGNDSIMLDRTISYDVDNLEYKPTRYCQ